MNAVRYHEYGSADVLRYEDVGEPTPGEGEVVIAMRACGVNHFDVDLRAGISRWPLPMPHQLGVEFAGVDRCGRGGRRGSRGRRRVWAQHEIECGACSSAALGGRTSAAMRRCSACSSSAVTPRGCWRRRAGTHPLPDGVSFEQAAAGQVAFTTAWHMLRHPRAASSAGQTVVVQAAGSGIGHAAVQIAALAGRARDRHRRIGGQARASPCARRRRDDQLPRGVDHRARARR